ncbi:GTP cyclohydrolase II [Sunxiuqinia elliptica]|uniref:GTP cyclohydrolase-2 n=1 Tax=Sunxiuqinia elliptica TaxID=655355 RepID=A0A1I2KL53_9BACT|nr:GTP cyclohydrolase II [Sunxiuqinia elliptica]SFF67243.1 3,4-dihydroxy 2-butanone 4-phosphate synthase / GTP cyclohydrolase II [Sunxiuqinia elliptica]
MFDRQQENTYPKNLTVGEQVDLPSVYGTFKLIPFQDKVNGLEHIALIKGNPQPNQSTLVRIHSACATGDLFGSLRCDCGPQLHQALRQIEQAGRGVLIYLQQEGRGIGLMEKIKAYKLQEQGFDTVDANLKLGHQADERDYKDAAEILHYLHISKVDLMTNNPLKMEGLSQYGITVETCIPIIIKPNKHNAFYLQTKQERMGHKLLQQAFDQEKAKFENLK